MLYCVATCCVVTVRRRSLPELVSVSCGTLRYSARDLDIACRRLRSLVGTSRCVPGIVVCVRRGRPQRLRTRAATVVPLAGPLTESDSESRSRSKQPGESPSR
jgi:hypothetical protein